MRKISYLLLLLIVVAVSSGVWAQDSGTKCPLPPQPQREIVKGVLDGREREFADGEILVRFKGEKLSRVIKVPKGKVIEKVLEYRQRDDVLCASPNSVVVAY